MNTVYIAHPISGDLSNLRKAAKIAANLSRSFPDICPLVPYYSDCVALDDNDPAERARGMMNSFELFRRGAVDELWLYGDTITTGMLWEIQWANAFGVTIRAKSKNTHAQLRAWRETLEAADNLPRL